MKPIARVLLGSPLLTIALLSPVTPALASSTDMPWESRLETIMNSVNGPVAKMIGVMVIVATGLAWAFGDAQGGAKNLIKITFGLSVAFTATSFFLDFFGYSSGLTW